MKLIHLVITFQHPRGSCRVADVLTSRDVPKAHCGVIRTMRVPNALKIWTFTAFFVVDAISKCASKASPRQIGSPQATILLLQCNNPNTCGSAAFRPPPGTICLIRTTSSQQGTSGVRIYLDSCTNAGGFFIDTSANIVSSNQGANSPNTVFTDTSCGTICGTVESVTYTSSNGMLVAQGSQLRVSNNTDCSKALFVFPDLQSVGACRTTGPSGPSGATGPPRTTVPPKPPRRKCPSQTQERVLLTITEGSRALAVGAPERLVDGSYRLPIVQERNGETFYTQEYISRAIGATGSLETVTAYTIQHGRSRKYLVADVLDDTTLNYGGPNTTGLNLMDASEFPAGYAREPDYRLFIKYNVTTYLVTGTVFCPLFHRSYCIYPGVSGYLRLAPLNSTQTSVDPTFVNPTVAMLSHFLLNSRPPYTSKVWYFTPSVI